MFPWQSRAPGAEARVTMLSQTSACVIPLAKAVTWPNSELSDGEVDSLGRELQSHVEKGPETGKGVESGPL